MANPALIVPAAKNHTATVIMAHGLGDSGAGWISLAENWRRRGKFEQVKFIFPNAPTIPITVNFGVSMPGWYDITTFQDLKQAHDEPGILRSRTVFNSLIADEIKSSGIPSDRIVLGGFSQGGAMSIFTGVTTPYKLAGIFALSAYLLLGDKIKVLAEENGNVNKDTKFFMAHGDADLVVKYDWGLKTADILRQELGMGDLEFKTFHGLGHSADPLEIDNLETFISKCLPPLEDGAGKGDASG